MFALHTKWYDMTKAEKTRSEILNKSMSVIYQNGYQAASIDEIIKNLNVTKGAFFYHFKSKEDMCVSMINEVFKKNSHKLWVVPLEGTKDPVKDIPKLLRSILYDEEYFDVRYGCPTINLIEEMSPQNAVLRKLLRQVMNEWIGGLEQVLAKGKEQGTVSAALNPKDAANFIVAGYAGARGMGKVFGTSAYENYLTEIGRYLSTQ
jgi:TetR/AcrR family transcriptional repressor of nem operon